MKGRNKDSAFSKRKPRADTHFHRCALRSNPCSPDQQTSI